jgi:hypothetical protein
MITTANRIFVHWEYATRFEDRFRNRAWLVDGMPGFISNQLLRLADLLTAVIGRNGEVGISRAARTSPARDARCDGGSGNG